MSNLSRKQITQLLHKWGHAVIESILDPDCLIFTHEGIEGLIGYIENEGCVLAYGDPVCASEDRWALAEAFHQKFSDKNIIYIVASKSFKDWLHQSNRFAYITFGEELYLNPQVDPRAFSGKKAGVLRRNMGYAQKAGVVVGEYLLPCAETEKKLQALADAWLNNRRGLQVYICNIRLFEERESKRWFYAQKGQHIVGAIVLNQLHAKKGWGLDRIMVVPDAPKGTSELLLTHVIEGLGQEGSSHITFGAINGSTLGEMEGFNPVLTLFSRFFYGYILKIFRIHNKSRFWKKFHPDSDPVYLAFKGAKLGFFEIKGLIRALHISFPMKWKLKGEKPASQILDSPEELEEQKEAN